jgi:hypothetical protein
LSIAPLIRYNADRERMGGFLLQPTSDNLQALYDRVTELELLVADLQEELKRAKHVTALTCVPQYPEAEIAVLEALALNKTARLMAAQAALAQSE